MVKVFRPGKFGKISQNTRPACPQTPEKVPSDPSLSRCVLNTVDGPSEQVEDYLCDPEKMPLGARNSRLPCPEDCVLSDWGSWSPCPMVRRTLAPLCRARPVFGSESS